MLNVLGVHTYYGDSHVLQGVTMTVAKGTVTAVLGRNGVGKTTLCRSLAGLTPARAGRIVYNGTEITDLPPHTICRMRISLVPQGRRIFSSLTVEENLAIAVLLIEHDIDVAFGFAERITVLYQGRVLIEGPKEVVSANRSVQESYLGLLVR